MKGAATRHKLACAAIFLCLCSWCWASKAPAKSVRTADLKEVLSLSTQEMTDQGTADILSFDITPDNQALMVGLRLTQPDRKASVWVARWEVASGRLARRTMLGEPALAQASGVPFVRLRVTSDGKLVVAQREKAIEILEVNSLSVLRSIPIASSSFQISEDSRILAVIVGQETDRVVHIFNLQSGAEIGQWQMPASTRPYYNATLSPHGNQILLVSAGPAPDILLVDSMTGREIRTFTSGFRYLNDGTFGVGSARFLSDFRFVAVPSAESDPSGRYAGKALRVFDVDTGEVLKELAYKHLGPTDDVWISRTGDALAMVSAWRSPSQNRRDIDVGIPITLLFFQTSQSEPSCIVENFPEPENAATTGVVLSADLGVVAVKLGENVRVYKVGHCDIVDAQIKH
jgi:WD40 repeat protein